MGINTAGRVEISTVGRVGMSAAAQRRRCVAIPAVITALMLSGCTGTPPTTAPPTTVSSASVGGSASVAPAPASPTTASSPTTATGPESLVRAAVAKLNAAAESVAGQQRVLTTLVAPGQRAAQRSCPAATSTLTLEPVYAELAPTPDWRPGTGVLAGTVYSLPTLIRIHRDGRIVGTDLAELHTAVAENRVGLTVLCIA